MKFWSHYKFNFQACSHRWVWNKNLAYSADVGEAGLIGPQELVQIEFEVSNLSDYPAEFQQNYNEVMTNRQALATEHKINRKRFDALTAEEPAEKFIINQHQRYAMANANSLYNQFESVAPQIETWLQTITEHAVDSQAIQDFSKTLGLPPEKQQRLNEEMQTQVPRYIQQLAQAHRLQRELEAKTPARRAELKTLVERNSAIAKNLTEINQERIPELERQKSHFDMELERQAFMKEFDKNGDGIRDDLETEASVGRAPTIAQQVAKLLELSRNEGLSDVISDKRDTLDWGLDQLGAVFEALAGEEEANAARREANLDDAKITMVNYMDDVAIQQFLYHHPSAALSLLTDKIGPRKFRVDFLANDFLETKVDLVQLVPGQPQYLKVDEHLAYLTFEDGTLVYKWADRDGIVEIDTNSFVEMPPPSGIFPEVDNYPNLKLATNAERADFNGQRAMSQNDLMFREERIKLIKEELGVSAETPFRQALEKKFPGLKFTNNIASIWEAGNARIQSIRNNLDHSPLERDLAIVEVNTKTFTAIDNFVRQGYAEIEDSATLSPEQKAEAKTALRDLFDLSITQGEKIEAKTRHDLERAKNILVGQIVRKHFRHLKPQLQEAIQKRLLDTQAETAEDLVTFLIMSTPSEIGEAIKNGDSDLIHSLAVLAGHNARLAKLESRVAYTEAEDLITKKALAEGGPRLVIKQLELTPADRATLEAAFFGPPLEPAARTQQIKQAIAILEAAKPKRIQTMEGVLKPTTKEAMIADLKTALGKMEEGQTAEARADAHVQTVNEAERIQVQLQDENYARVLGATAKVARKTGGEVPPELITYLASPDSDFSPEKVDRVVHLINSEAYQSASPVVKEALFNTTVNSPPNTPITSPTVLHHARAQLPTGVKVDNVILGADGQFETHFTDRNQEPFIQYNGKTILAEKFIGLPDAEDIATENWFMAQAFATFTDGSPFNAANRDATQSAEAMGPIAMKTYFENMLIALNRSTARTMNEAEADQWVALGEMCRQQVPPLTLQAFFTHLSGLRKDGSLNPNHAAKDAPKLLKALDFAVSRNQKGFQEILGLS